SEFRRNIAMRKKTVPGLFFTLTLLSLITLAPAIWLSAGPEGAPVFDWVRTFGSDLQGGYEEGHSVATDSQGNVYVTGAFNGTVDFNPGGAPDVHTSRGREDIFITKFYADGSYAWTYTMGAEAPDQGRGIAVDPDDNILVTGSFHGRVDFDPGPGEDIHTSHD